MEHASESADQLLEHLDSFDFKEEIEKLQDHLNTFSSNDTDSYGAGGNNTMFNVSTISRSQDENVLPTSEKYAAVLTIAAIVFTFGLLANLAVIGRVLRQGVLRARIRMLLLSLSCADVLFIVIEFPMNQIAWMSTVAWKAGDFMCRTSMYGRAFATYLISFILVVISLDRCLNTVKPAAPKAASKRMKKLLWTALGCAFIFATPQILIFRTVDVPGSNTGEKQCISRGLADNILSLKIIYPLFAMISQYVIPIALISLDYVIILYTMSKPVGQSGDIQQLILFRQTSKPNHNSIKVTTVKNQTSSHDAYIRKAQMQTLHILLVTVVVFFLCWLPYYIVMILNISATEEELENMSPWPFKVSELIAASNACINPFIYGNYLLKVKERCISCWPYSWR